MKDFDNIRAAEIIALGTIRIPQKSITIINSLIDKAYWALETDVHVLKEADRPLINNPDQAKEAIGELADFISNIEDLGLNTLDEKLGELSHAINKLDNISFKGNIYIET